MSHTEGKLHTGGIFNPTSNSPTVNLWSETQQGLQSGEIIAQQVSLPNARRLVACWNEHDELVRERDEALEALRDAQVLLANNPTWPDGMDLLGKIDAILSRYPEES